MSPKIFVGAAVGVLVILIASLVVASDTPFDIVSPAGDGGTDTTNIQSSELALDIQLDRLEIVEIDETFAILEVGFKVSNPNQRSVILQFVKYQLFDDDDRRIHAGEIGQQFDGFVVGSNFYPVMSDSYTVLSDEIVLKNTGILAEVWDDLSDNPASLIWSIDGEVFFNLSSMTAGGENTLEFSLEATVSQNT